MRRLEPLSSWKQRDGPRAPLRTSVELAEELGTHAKVMVPQMNADPDGPRPVIDGRRDGNKSRVLWYRPAEVRAWWAKRNAAKA